MHKEIKRLTLLSNCVHLSKTDRDSITWAIQQIEPPEVEPEKGFDGFDFSTWPEVPSQELFSELVKSRKAKHGIIMTQSWINKVSIHMGMLNESGVTIDRAIGVASANGWQGFNAKWVLNELEIDVTTADNEEVTNGNVMQKIKAGIITHISQIPSPVRSEIDSNVRFGRIKKPAALVALCKIGFIL